MITVGVWLLGHALRTFGHPLLRKGGAALYVVSTGLAGYFLTGSLWGAAGGVMLWAMLPWVEILLRVRRMRLPMDKALKYRPAPSRDDFPHLGDLTEEIEEAGFEQAQDAGWDWQETRQFLRIMVDTKARQQVVIHLNQQRQMGIAWVSLTSRTRDGRSFVTWNYPFSQTMHPCPETLVNPAVAAESFTALREDHQDLLETMGVLPEDLAEVEADHVMDVMSRELKRQIDHNLSRGIIKPSGEGTFRYSWRGFFFLWGQFLKDMARLA